MTSKASLENKRIGTVFAWQFRRSLPLTAIYLVLFLGVCLVPPYHQPNDVSMALSVVMLGFSLLIPPFLFSECFSRRQADVLHALPVKREVFFAGSFLSALASLWLPVVLGLPLRHMLCLICRNAPSPVGTAFLLLHFLVIGSAALAFFLLMAVCSGTLFEYGLISLVLSLAAPLLMTYLPSVIFSTIPGADLSCRLTHFLRGAISPPVALFFVFRDMELPLTVLWYGVLFLLLTAAGCGVYRRRKSESSGVSRCSRGIEYVARVELSLMAAFFLGSNIPGRYRVGGVLGIFLTLGAMLLGLMLVWLLTELLYHHSLKKLFRHFQPLVAAVLIWAAVLGVVSTGMGLDTPPLEQEEAVGATMEYYDAGSNGALLSELHVGLAGAEEGTLGKLLSPGVTSPEGIAQVLGLQRKWIEMERASQYPYLPGRKGDGNVGIQLHYYTEPGGKWVSYSWVNYSQNESVLTGQGREKLGEIRDSWREIAASEEMMSSYFPINALGALTEVGVIDTEEKWDGQGYYGLLLLSEPGKEPKEVTAGKKIGGFSKDFLQKLEQALREDIAGERHLTIDFNAERPRVYELMYTGEKPFTAKGGLLTGNGSEPAAGQTVQLERNEIFLIYPEMTETYALLEKEYQK